MPAMTHNYIAGLEGCSRVSQSGLGGGGIQGTDYTKLFSLPYFPFSFYLIRMKRQKQFQGNAPEVSLQLCSCPGRRLTPHHALGLVPTWRQIRARGTRHCSGVPGKLEEAAWGVWLRRRLLPGNSAHLAASLDTHQKLGTDTSLLQ